jgi:hypothetical protein
MSEGTSPWPVGTVLRPVQVGTPTGCLCRAMSRYVNDWKIWKIVYWNWENEQQLAQERANANNDKQDKPSVMEAENGTQ